MSQFKEANLRLNIILKQKDQFRVSLIVHPKTTVARLKRNIQQQLQQLHGITILVSVIENTEGFVLSNNSAIGDHVKSNDSLYVSTHKQKIGTNMNLPANVTDLFMTLRYVCGSVIGKLQHLDIELDPLEVVPQIIHLGFWYSNIETVLALCKLLNKIFTPETLERFYRQAHQMQNIILLKLFSFWLAEVRNSLVIFSEVAEEFLTLLYKLSLNKDYSQLLRTHKIMKNVIELSKEVSLAPEMKRMAVQTIRNVTGKGNINSNSTSAYIPTALYDSTSGSNTVDALELIVSNSQEAKLQGLQQLADNPRLISQATVRFDYYFKLTSLFTIKTIKDKQTASVFSHVVKTITSQTTKQKAKQIMQKDIIRKIHNFLLESHPDCHSSVYEYYSLIARESSCKGLFNVQQASQFLGSPYIQFLQISLQALQEMSDKDKKTSPIRFLPHIKDYIKLSLKTQNQTISNNLLKIISNLTLDQQCRYQILNLKGLQIFVKFLQIGQKNSNSQLQRTCAKALLNLSLSSRQAKVKALSLMVVVLDKLYKGTIDSIAASYIQNILKSPTN